MKAKTISSGEIERTFIITMFTETCYTLEEVTLNEDDVRFGALKTYGIDADEEYSLLTASQYVGERDIWNIEIGEVLEIDDDEKIMRVA